LIRLRRRPAFRALPATAAAAVIALASWAGTWQSGRALEKDEIEARAAAGRDAVEMAIGGAALTAEAVDGRKLSVRGEFIAAATVYWDNRFAGRVSGMAVITPLRPATGGKLILVDRGLAVPGGDRSKPPPVATPAGMVEIHGRAYIAPRRTLELKENTDAGNLWQNLTPGKFAARTGLDVQPFILRQIGDSGGEGLTRAPDMPSATDAGMTAAKHRGYAFQWYSLALLTLALFLFFALFRHDKPPRDT
jgi:cytochrome oxidase assembly protein ShyY1